LIDSVEEEANAKVVQCDRRFATAAYLRHNIGHLGRDDLVSAAGVFPQLYDFNYLSAVWIPGTPRLSKAAMVRAEPAAQFALN
jgi:hypothetical protein